MRFVPRQGRASEKILGEAATWRKLRDKDRTGNKSTQNEVRPLKNPQKNKNKL